MPGSENWAASPLIVWHFHLKFQLAPAKSTAELTATLYESPVQSNTAVLELYTAASVMCLTAAQVKTSVHSSTFLLESKGGGRFKK